MVAVQEQFEAAPMHLVALGGGQGLAHKLPQPLAQGVVEALDMSCLAASFPRRDRLRRRDHRPLGVPEVCVAGRLAPGRGHLFPQKTAAFFTAAPQQQATAGRVSRSSATQTQAGSAFERTKGHNSSRSKTGAAPEAGNDTVSLKDGSAAAFF
jgi:hypothetical protein